MNRYLSIFALIIIAVPFLFSGCDKTKDVTGVTIIPDICVLKVGETRELTAIVSPDDADDQSVRWAVNALHPIDSTKGQDVVTISETGKVKGISEGFARIVCITNNMFCEAQALVMVGYSTAVKGLYTGSLSKNGKVVNNPFNIGIETLSEYEALFGLPSPIANGESCPVTVSRESDTIMYFEGENTINLQGVTTSVQVNGYVSLDGIGDFEITLNSDPVTKYTFFGPIIIGDKSRPF